MERMIRCELCKRSFLEHMIHKHHLDGNRKNNDKKNLVKLCRNCHMTLHKLGRPIRKDQKQLEEFSKEFDKFVDNFHKHISNCRECQNQHNKTLCMVLPERLIEEFDLRKRV